MMRSPRTSADLRLKVAIAGSGKTSRAVSIESRIGEVRLSAAVGGRAQLTDVEIRRVARACRVPAATLIQPAGDARVAADDVSAAQ